MSVLPACEKTLCAFVAWLANENLKHRTIKVYLSAVRHLQVAAALPDPFSGAPMARLQYVLRGIKKAEVGKGAGPRERLPITPSLLLRMKAVWEPSAEQPDTKMLWAACCLCFFAFLRVGEMTVPSDEAYDPAVHLSVQDVAVDNSSTPSLLRVTIKQSKTDPFRKGVDLYIGKTSAPTRPVAAVLNYLIEERHQAPCFCIRMGKSSHVRGSPKQSGDHWLVQGLTTPNTAPIASALELPQLQRQKGLKMQ